MQNDSLQRQNIDIKILTGEEILDIYTTHSIRHFPEDERKPVSSIQRMTAEGALPCAVGHTLPSSLFQ